MSLVPFAGKLINRPEELAVKPEGSRIVFFYKPGVSAVFFEFFEKFVKGLVQVWLALCIVNDCGRQLIEFSTEQSDFGPCSLQVIKGGIKAGVCFSQYPTPRKHLFHCGDILFSIVRGPDRLH